SGYHKGRPADKPQLPKGELTLDKTVDGGAFADWKLPAGYDGTLADLLADITFELYEADGTELKATGTLNAEGKITFDRAPGELAPGWYDVVEKLGPSAAEVFAPADKPVRIYFNGYSASVDGDTFDPSAEYYVSWDWVQNNAVVGHNGVPVKTTFANGVVWDGKKTEIWKDYLGTGQDNEIQGITARTSRGGDDYQEYVSFCAHVGSWSYAENNSYAAFELTDEARGKILSAFNYILTTGEYGEFSKNAPPNAARILAQLAVWYFLPPDSSEFEIVDFEFSGTWEWLNSEWPAVKEAGNSFRYAKTGPVKGLFYLTSGDEAGQRQPQIIPLFGDGVINNTTKGELNVDVNLVTEVQKQLQKTNTSVGTSTYGSSWTAVSDTPVLACPGENNSNQNLHYETILVENLPDGAVLGPYAIGSRDNANRAVGGSFWITRVGNEIFVVMDKDDVVTATGVVARVFTGEDVPCWGNAASNGGGVTLAGGGSTVATAGWDKGSRFQLTADVTTIHVAVKGATVAYVDPSKTTYACELVREDPIETKPYVGAAEVTFVVDGQRYGRDESASLAPGKYTVELWLDGEMVASLDDVVVSAGATTTASFGDVVVGQLEQDVWEENPVAGSPGCFTWL
ncbi:MAG: hypothetical protein FWF21_08260, partial [Micrococcales bacterium]|nr:hypothetical protein [Micrococcales bacterium]